MSRVRSALLAPPRAMFGMAESAGAVVSADTATAVADATTVSASRRYGVLVTTPSDGRGTWHTITAVSLVAALRDARTRRFWESAQVSYERDQAEISAIECLGLVGH